jgi:hypothetical protein
MLKLLALCAAVSQAAADELRPDFNCTHSFEVRASLLRGGCSVRRCFTVLTRRLGRPAGGVRCRPPAVLEQEPHVRRVREEGGQGDPCPQARRILRR